MFWRDLYLRAWPLFQAGTLEYMSPEVLLKHPVSQASDVYAYAITLNELASATVPFSDCTKVWLGSIYCG